MNSYDDKLETLLLSKDYAALGPAERSYVGQVLGGEVEYAAERTMRLRTRAVFAAETAPADPGGLAAVMARTKSRRSVVVPLWQAAAAALLLALFAWLGRGWTMANEKEDAELLAMVDTVLKEVRVVDTVYLPAANVEEHPLVVEQEEKPVVQPKHKRKPNTKASAKLVAAIEALPEPGVAGKSGGVSLASGFRPEELEAFSDKFSGAY